jgi:DNA modification methylase
MGSVAAPSARKKLAHNYEGVNEPLRPRTERVQAGPHRVRLSTLLHFEPEFGPNPSHHPARFPIELPSLSIKLMTQPGQVVFDPFAARAPRLRAGRSGT